MTITFSVKERESQTDAQAQFQLISTNVAQIDIYDPTNGRAYIYVQNTNTQDMEIRPYVYDVQLKSGGNNIETVAKGSFTIIGDVTRTI